MQYVSAEFTEMQALLNEKFHAPTFFKGTQVMAVENSAGWQLNSAVPTLG
jgi:hypothetical protein